MTEEGRGGLELAGRLSKQMTFLFLRVVTGSAICDFILLPKLYRLLLFILRTCLFISGF
jgi:hypothetical protein